MDFIRLYASLMASALVYSAAFGLNVSTSAGGLKAAVGEDASSVTELTVTGPIDASDLFFIDKSMPQLKSLDLYGAIVEEYSGSKLDGATTYPANTLPTGVFAGSKLESIVFPSSAGLAIGDMAFAGSQLKTVAVPPNVATVGQGAFASCRSLASASVSGSVICGSHTFKDCTSLVSVNMGGAGRIVDSEFAGCTALSDIEGIGELVAVGAYALSGCMSLDTFIFAPSLTSIGEGAFMGSGLHMADMELTKLDSISSWTFAYCSDLEIVKMPGTVKKVGEGAFFDCKELMQLVWPDNMVVLADYAMKGTQGLRGEVMLPGALESIGSYGLKGADGISTLTLPSTLSSLGDNAMEGMTGLTEIDGGTLDVVPALGSDVFAGVDQSAVRLNVKSEMLDAFKNADQWQEFDINDSQVGNMAPEAQTPSLRGSYTGDTLRLISNINIESVEIYNLAGELLGIAHPVTDTCTIATDAIGAPAMIIVRATLDGGRKAALKLAK